ncbi:serine/threonine-protein kinase [Planomonospora sp. ID91781]|uniref:serine/threonine-protein kinase n=1 Tax=Planomonospora sp. ID91781 TaxID=2738135 RepID=UPI0018C4090A|nr:serine/threonine-protein kinase [Planomonospora sp. ID91781]
MTGRTLAGRYRLLERLGEGGAGTVWRARDETLRRDVAVKELRGGAGFAERAIAEARAAARVNHPAIVMVHDVVTDGGLPWIVMDLIDGVSLDRLIERGPLPAPRVAAIGLRVLAALEAAHAHGMLHRDVKPGNVLVERDGTAVLADFGIAAPMTGEQSLADRAGSAGYTAPERLREEPAGPQSDLWALGATLYAAVEGRAPFRRDHPAAVAAAVLMHDPPAPVLAGPELGGLLLAMLAKDPARRPAPAAVRQVLDRIAATTSYRSVATAPVAPAVPHGASAVPHGALTVPARTGRRRRLRVAAAVVAVSAAVGAAIAWSTVTSPGDGPDRGRFAAAPEACDLLTVEQVRELVGQVTDPRMTKVDECTWNYLKRGVPYRWISVQTQAVPPHGETPAPEAARLLFESMRRETDSEAGGDTAFGRQTRSRVRALPGVGEEAFARDYVREGANISRTVCSVWLRVSNLIVRVEWTRAEDGGVRPADRRTVLRAAERVAAGLVTPGPSGPSGG